MLHKSEANNYQTIPGPLGRNWVVLPSGGNNRIHPGGDAGIAHFSMAISYFSYIYNLIFLESEMLKTIF